MKEKRKGNLFSFGKKGVGEILCRFYERRVVLLLLICFLLIYFSFRLDTVGARDQEGLDLAGKERYL